MIPKADILERARLQGLQGTTVEKDYVLGWVLRAIGEDGVLGRWIFKGGTCLKKCFFETYRFSEDLDFTVPSELPLDQSVIRAALERLSTWIEERCGLQFPRERILVEEYKNPRGNPSYQARLAYIGPLLMGRRSLQKVKFDITQDEIVASTPAFREVHHPYRDGVDPAALVQTYSLEEVLAEKTRALYERQGRARDVYDVVHLGRTFRDEIDPGKAVQCVRSKFAFKGIGEPTVHTILARIDNAVLNANWEDQLAHQVPLLPAADGFIADIKDALAWWLEPDAGVQREQLLPRRKHEELVPRVLFPPRGSYEAGKQVLETIRFSARNRICVRVRYHQHDRLVEPYSLRRPETGNLLLYVHELAKEGTPVGETRAYKVEEILAATLTSTSFKPRWRIEL